MNIGARTCSELSLRVLLWNASYVQKHQQLNDMMNMHIYIFLITGDDDDIVINQQRYNIGPPQLRLKCAQGRDYIHKCT